MTRVARASECALRSLGWAVIASGAVACTRPAQGVVALHPGDTIAGEITQDDLATPADFSGYPGDGAAPEADASGVPDEGAPDADTMTHGDTYALDLAAGQSVQVVMCRAGGDNVIDPYLIVDLQGAHLLADDDSAGDLDALVQIDAAAAGRYTVYAAVVTGRVAASGGRGYVLRVENTDPARPLGCSTP
ncbi:MAG: PPC domain-containing protein [Deltaproteobacteria bacterium]